jgi:K+-sensing histidine kinase KdpD
LGVGLGLAIVAELASAMEARVDAQSPLVDGRGARMVVWLRGRSSPDAKDGTDESMPSSMLTPALPLHPPV